MAELDDLLGAARKARREDRISWRDPIAAFGREAVPIVSSWMTDAELGAFAVRVLEEIAGTPGNRNAVIQAFKSVDSSSVAAPVARDIADALARLGYGPRLARAADAKRAMPAEWSGYATAPPLEKHFHDDMLDIFRLAGEATRKQRSDGSYVRGYWASYFLRGVRNHGGLVYARRLLHAEGTTEGFARLTDEKRLDLTMEALVLRPEYRELFSETDRQVAASRLARAGYQPQRLPDLASDRDGGGGPR